MLQLLSPERAAIASTNSDRYIEESVEAITSTELAQDREQQPDTTTLFKFDDAVLAGFRIGYRQDAASTADKTLAGGALATQKLLQMAGLIQSMKMRLNRKEFGVFVKGLLQWGREEARKYLDIQRFSVG